MTSSSDLSLNVSISNTSMGEEATPIIRIFGATSYAAFCATSILMNSILLSILIRGRQEYKKYAFYTIVWQHVICDLMSVAVQIIISVPITYAGYNVYNSALFITVIGFFDTLGFYGDVHFAFLMTINRFTVFIMPRVNKLLFEWPRFYITIAIAWCYIIFLTIGVYFVVGCKKGFATTGFYLYNDCPQYMTQFNTCFRAFQNYSLTYLPVIMIIAYVCMYIYIKIALFGNMHSSAKRDFAILIQCFLICAFLELEDQTFSEFPFIPVYGQWKFMLSFLQNWIVIINNTISSIVLFIFNSEIRTSLKQLFTRKENVTVQISIPNGKSSDGRNRISRSVSQL